ncbi:putative orfan [Tupanvirus soda lake]|uniref:Orfan n=2 Tax=Tupanvirus TaxID=2094720 RepID=A0AC62ABT7_9VIRU|nr:putative orfan [Tupanvirus soda lake]QKU35255.1 putative orfan [Tupanvirus soda lake]
MEVLCIGLITASSFFAIVNDIARREKFNNLMKNKTDGKFKLIEGVVNSQYSIPSINPECYEKIIGKKITGSTKSYHTYYTNQTIYTDGKTSIQIPVAQTYEEWNKDNVSRQFVNDIFLSNFGMSTIRLFFPQTAKIMWDKKYTKVVNNSETKEKILLNDQYKYVFGSSSNMTTIETKNVNLVGNNNNDNNNVVVKYIGDESFVKNKIRSDHYGISNWKTCLYSLVLTSSLLYMTSQTNQKRR